MTEFAYQHRRVTHSDGMLSDVYTAHFAADRLRMTDIVRPDVQSPLRDATHLRHYQAAARGVRDPLVVGWACLDDDQPVTALFPDQDAVTASGEHILSANSWITYVLRTLLARGELRWHAGAWDVAIGSAPDALPGWADAARSVVMWLAAAERLHLESGPAQPHLASGAPVTFEGFDAQRDLIPVGPCGFARDIALAQRPRLVFNSAFFLLEHDDFLSHHSALGEAHGLYVAAGRIVRPPLYRRAAIWRMPSGWRTGAFGMQDVAIRLPDGTLLQPAGDGLRFHVNPAADASDVALYTRSCGVATQGRVLGTTPEQGDRLLISVVDTRIAGWQRGGSLLIPQNGFVLSFAPGVLTPDQVAAVQQYGQLRYRFVADAHQGIDQALQCGPQLVRDGESALMAHSLADEDFWMTREIDGETVIGAVPTEYPDDVDRTRAGRVGLGIDAAGDLVLVVVPGVSKHIAQTAQSTSGATLAELADYLLAAGAVDAINLDGGGSTQAFVDGGLLARQGDPRGYDGVIFDRMVPSVGVVLAGDSLE